MRTIAKNLDLTPFDGVTHILTEDFGYSNSLRKIVIPAGVVSISSHVFIGSSQEITLIVLPSVPPAYNGNSNYTIWNNASVVNTNHPMYVPDGSLEAYKTATSWSIKANYMKKLSEYNGDL